MLQNSRFLRASAFALTVIVAAGCAGGDEGSDTAAFDTAAATPAATPAPMDSSAMAGMNRPPAKDADHEFLRMMTDHHQGLVVMATEAMTKASATETQTDAHNLHTKQDEEAKKMIGMIQTSYGETFQPVVTPDNKAMNDSLQAKSGPEYDRTFYANVIKHHQGGIKMIDDYMARLTKPDVKQMAEKMKADQQKEIAEFQRKMNNVKA